MELFDQHCRMIQISSTSRSCRRSVSRCCLCIASVICVDNPLRVRLSVQLSDLQWMILTLWVNFGDCCSFQEYQFLRTPAWSASPRCRAPARADPVIPDKSSAQTFSSSSLSQISDGGHSSLEVALLEVCLDRRRQRGNLILLRFDECRMVALAILCVSAEYR